MRMRRLAIVMAGIGAIMVFLSAGAFGQDDSAGVRWWWEKYQTVGRRDPKWDSLVLDGIRLWMAGKHGEALGPFDKALESGCECPIVKYIRGNAEHGSGANPDVVFRSLNDALQSAGDRPEYGFVRFWAWNTMGARHELLGAYEKAMDCYARAETATSEDVDPYYRKQAAERAARCKEVITVMAVVLPPNATKVQVREYLEAVLANAPNITWASNDPWVNKLAAIGPENLDALLELNLKRSARGAFHFEEAVRKLAGPGDKDLILNWLPAQTHLAAIVLEQGWTAEAKPILLQGLAFREDTLSPDWIRAAALLRAPESYEDLRWYVVNGYYSREIYEAVKDIPEIRAREALGELWAAWERGERGKPNSRSKPGAAAMCLQAGVPGALEYAIDSLDVNWKNSLYRGTARDLVLTFTDATGTNEELRQWFRKNRRVLVFDDQSRKFRVPEGARPEDIPESPERLAAYRKADAMREVRKWFDVEYDTTAEFNAALQSAADLLTEVPVAIDQEPPKPVRIVMSAHGEGIDAVKFRAPEGLPRDMIWAFAWPLDNGFWYILRAQGPAGPGFGSKDYWNPPYIEGSPEWFTYQYLDSRRIEQGEEYILWFSFTNREPAEVEMAIKFVPHGTVANTLESLSEALKCNALWDRAKDLYGTP